MPPIRTHGAKTRSQTRQIANDLFVAQARAAQALADAAYRRTLNHLFSIPPIQVSFLRELTRFDLLQLELAGVRASAHGRTHDRYYRGARLQCNIEVDFQLHPRRNLAVLNVGVGRCPNTNVTTARLEYCRGSRRYDRWPISWDHEQSLRFGRGCWGAMNRPRNHQRHPPGNGLLGRRWLICSQCLRDESYKYSNEPQDDVNRRRITRHWVPFCQSHSRRLYRIMQDEPWPLQKRHRLLCRCVEHINRGWVCRGHRMETLAAIETRSDHHIAWLCTTRLRKPRRLRLEVDYEKERTRKRREKRSGQKQTQCYVDEGKPSKRWPGCPVYGCGKPSWKSPTALERLSRCLGCGGMQSCAGSLDDLRATNYMTTNFVI